MQVDLSAHYGYRKLLVSSIPLILMLIVTSVYSIVDGLFVANCAGTTAFAALNLIWPAIMLIGAMGIMTGTGGAALVSKTMGEGDRKRANEIFSMIIWFTLLAAVLLAVPLYFLMEPLALLLGADEALLAMSVRYGRILALGLPFFVLQMCFQPFFMTAERPQLGVAVSLTCCLTNILMDALLVWLLDYGLVGAGLATIFSQIVGALYVLWYFLRRKNDSAISLSRCPLEPLPILKACHNGLSEYVGNISLSIVSICYNLQLMRYIGPDGVSAYGIIMYVSFVFAAVFIGFNMTVSPIVSFHYGAGDSDELKCLLRQSLRIVLLGGMLMTVIAELLAEPMAAVFADGEQVLLNLTVKAIRIYMLCFVIAGVSMLVSAWFTALNNGTVSAVVAVFRTLVFEVACVFLLPLILGVDGIWMSVDVAETASVLLSVFLLLRYRRRYGY